MEPDSLVGLRGLISARGMAPRWNVIHHGDLLDHVAEVKLADRIKVDAAVFVEDVDEVAPHPIGEDPDYFIGLDGEALMQPVPDAGLDLWLLENATGMRAKRCGGLIVAGALGGFGGVAAVGKESFDKSLVA